MTGYQAAIPLATACMLIVHVDEWRSASAMTARLRFGCKPAAEASRLRWEIRLEALYYLLILPYVYSTSGTLLGQLLALAAIYHWGGLALAERSGIFDRWAASGSGSYSGGRIGAIWAVAVLDIAEMLLLGRLLWVLLVPVTAVTGIPAAQA